MDKQKAAQALTSLGYRTVVKDTYMCRTPEDLRFLDQKTVNDNSTYMGRADEVGCLFLPRNISVRVIQEGSPSKIEVRVTGTSYIQRWVHEDALKNVSWHD